jgi:hypothetical protein
VYVRDAEGELVLHPLPAPSAEEVAQGAAWTHAGIVRVLERHGRSLEGADDTPHEGASEEPVLAACYAASASDAQLLGAAPGRKTDKLVRPLRVVPSATEPLAEVGGVDVHAKVAVGARDHPRRERSCRYLLRPPLAQDRLTLQPDGRLRLAFEAAWKDGTHAVLLDPLDLIARLCALVPPPRFIAALPRRARRPLGRARPDRARTRAAGPPAQQPLFEASEAPLAPAPFPSRHPWAWLLRRVFAVEVSLCPVPTCGGRMRIVDIATTPEDVERVLGAKPTRARAPPPSSVSTAQLPLVFA